MPAPAYRDLVSAVPPLPAFPEGDAGVTTPPPDEAARYRRAAADLADRLRGLRGPGEVHSYLGMEEIAPGRPRIGRDTALPYPPAGSIYIAQPAETAAVPYPIRVASRVVPNILYDVYLAARGASQKRTLQSPGHLHPAVNLTQANALGLLEWLSEAAGFELRLPTELEWEHIARAATTPEARGNGKFRVEDPYVAMPIDDPALADDRADRLALFGNVWEMTTPSLVEDFMRVPGQGGRVIEGCVYHAKGGGFQHCGLGAGASYAFTKSVAERSASTGLRFVAAERSNGRANGRPSGGWRRRTKPIGGATLCDETGIGHATVQVAQSPETRGLSLKVNGRAHAIDPERAGICPLPRRGTALTDASGELVARQPEHVLAALAGLGTWNALILLDGEPALPAAGYCALDFAEAIRAAGLRPGSDGELVVAEPITFELERSSAELLPGPSRLEVEIDFPHLPGVGRQVADFDPRGGDFTAELAPARSFVAEVTPGFAYEQWRLADLRRYPSAAEAPLLMFDGERWNHEFRFANEPARHKLCDLLGDLAILGMPVIGDVRVRRPGHAFNVALVRHLRQLCLACDERLQVREATGSDPGGEPRETGVSAAAAAPGSRSGTT